jgi:protein-L-isoaspartate O-methyltransferase
MEPAQTGVNVNKPGFFDFAAEVGLTKHIGGVEATEAIIQLCHIAKDSYILDVGCGVGATACFIANKVGCRVMGVDILKRWSRDLGSGLHVSRPPTRLNLK